MNIYNSNTSDVIKIFSGFIDFQAQSEGRVFVFKDDFVQIGGLILRVDGLNGILSSQLKTKQYN